MGTIEKRKVVFRSAAPFNECAEVPAATAYMLGASMVADIRRTLIAEFAFLFDGQDFECQPANSVVVDQPLLDVHHAGDAILSVPPTDRGFAGRWQPDLAAVGHAFAGAAAEPFDLQLGAGGHDLMAAHRTFVVGVHFLIANEQFESPGLGHLDGFAEIDQRPAQPILGGATDAISRPGEAEDDAAIGPFAEPDFTTSGLVGEEAAPNGIDPLRVDTFPELKDLDADRFLLLGGQHLLVGGSAAVAADGKSWEFIVDRHASFLVSEYANA